MIDKNSAGNFGIGLLVGAAIGVTLGFLFAPHSGKETREQIKQKATELVEKVKSKAAEMKHPAEAQ